MSDNNNHKKLIAMIITVITTVLLATAGWTFGIIKSQAEKDLIRMETQMNQIEQLLQDILVTQGINQNDISHIQEDMVELREEISQMHQKLNLFITEIPHD